MPINLRALPITLILAGIVSAPLFAVAQQESSTEILLDGAKKWVERDRSDLARGMLHKVLLIEPNSPKALLMLGKIELKDGKRSEAQRYLLTMQQTSPDSPSTRELNEAINGKAPTPESTAVKIAEAKPVTETKPVSARKTPAKSKIREEKKSRRKQGKTRSVPEENRLAPENPASDTASIAVDPDISARTDALDALDDGKLDVAENALQDLLKRRPKDPEVLGGLGLIRLRQGKPDEAENWFAQALAVSKDGEDARWKSLVKTAGFWKNMHIANQQLDANKFAEAEATVQQALQLQPDDPNALALLGNIKAANNENAEAERLYREALSKEGSNVSAIRGLSSLLSRTQRGDEALDLIERALQDYPDEWKKDPGSQASLMRAEAELYITAHRTSQAIQALETAILLDPKDPWVRFSLAKLYISLDMTQLGLRVVQEGVELMPTDPTMLYVNALILMSLDEYAAALDSLNQVPDDALTQSMRETRDRAMIQLDLQQARNQMAKGNRKEAIRIMAIAEAHAQGNYSATEQVAEGWYSLGMKKQGLAAMRKLPAPVPLKTQVYFASLLNRAEQDQELTDYLPTLNIPAGTDDTTVKYRETIQDIEFAMAGRQYDKLMKAGKTEQAQQFADTILDANRLSIPDYFKFHRIYFSRAKLPDSAIPMLNQEKEQHPDDLDIRWDLAYAYYQEKQTSEAKREIQELLALTKSDDVDMHLRIASLQQNIGDNTGARKTVDELISRDPNNTDLLLQAGKIAQSDGQYNRAMSYYRQAQQVPPAAPQKPEEKSAQPDITLDLLPARSTDSGPSRGMTPTLVSTSESNRIYQNAISADTNRGQQVNKVALSETERAMESIRSRRSPKIEAGLDIQTKTSNSGTSTYNATEVPLLARIPIGYEAHGTVQIDKVNIDAGALPSTFADAALFGKIRAYQIVPPQPLTPAASGTSIGLGYEQDSFKADIGKVGIGFPVSNVVGGIRHGGSIGRMSYSVNFSRRPYTGSLLSYAGAKDPVTGEAWGGVTNTGVSLYLATTLATSALGDFNLSAVTNYGLLRGKNVLNNDRLYLRAAIDSDIYASEDSVLNLGFNINFTRFSKNEAFYTFGHGGYYSPQSSLSFGLPIEWIGRADLLSYQLQASVSYSRTSEDAAIYYPTNPALQAQAVAAANGATTYAGGTGGGFGYGLLAASEYRATPNFVLGGRFSMNRSAYYAPNSLLFYLRYLFKPETGQVSMRPDPVIPYSQY